MTFLYATGPHRRDVDGTMQRSLEHTFISSADVMVLTNPFSGFGSNLGR